MPESDAEAALEARKPGDAPVFWVWEENWETFMVFNSLATQWHRIAGFAGSARTGLMYSEAREEMRERGIGRERRNEMMGDLRVMEYAAIEEWSKPSDG